VSTEIVFSNNLDYNSTPFHIRFNYWRKMF